ncbi:hypothetical protein [Sorangium sp. So ce426]|uniref:hypothetical protein n=1 Tax=unclassified Sorangium TaxID=2621164 RepID=UPI003F5C8904
MKWSSIVFLGCLLVACGDDEVTFGSGGAGGSADGGGGSAEGGGGAGTGGSAEGGGGSAEGGGGAGTGGSAEGGGGAGTGGNAEGGGGAGGSAEGGGGAGTGGSAEGGGGAGTGGNAEGGGTGGTSLDRTELAIAPGDAATAGCATFVDGAWGVGETDFIGGEPTNDDCALVPVLVDGSPYWITSREFEGDIDLDSLEHSFPDAAAAIGEGSYSIVLRNFTFEEIFTGSIEVADVTDEAVTLSIE